MTTFSLRKVSLFWGVFLLLSCSISALPLTELDRRAFSAFTSGFLPTINFTAPFETLNQPPWTLDQIPNICTAGYTQITCMDVNATHSSIIKIEMDLDQTKRKAGYMLNLLPEFYLFPSLAEINLPCATIVGPISPDIGRMTSLRSWYFEGSSDGPRLNQAPAPLPSEIGNLYNLELFGMVQQFLNGPIPSSFSNLTNLHTLILEANLLTGPFPDLAALTRMSDLNVKINHLSGNLPSSIGSYTNLMSLQMGNNEFTGNIPALPTNGKLTILDLSWNNLEGSIPASAMANQPNLAELHMEHNRLSGSIPDQAALPSAMIVNLGFNRLSGPLPANFIASLSGALNQFFINDNAFTGALPDLSSKPNLLQLDFSANRWTPGPFPMWTINMQLLTFIRLAQCNIIGDIPTVGLSGRTYSSKDDVLDLSGNNLRCPSVPLTNFPSLGCFLHENDFCSPGREHLFQPNCSTIPVGCRTTPCRAPSAIIPVPSLAVCSGPLVEIPSASPSLRLLFDPCYPKAIMQFTPKGAAQIEISAAVLNVSDVVNDYVYRTWRTPQQQWMLEYRNFSSANNSKITEMRYRTVLPNGANFSVPFFYYENGDSLKIFQEALTIPPKTLKFGIDVDGYKPSSRRGRSYLGLDIVIEANQPFLSDLADLAVFFDPMSTIRVLPIRFSSGSVITFRIPTLGQDGYKLDLTGSLPQFGDPRVQALVNAITNRLPLSKLELPLRLACSESMSFDPDLSLLFDISDPPVGAPGDISPGVGALAVEQNLTVVGIIVGSIVAALVLIFVILLIAIPPLRHKIFPFLNRTKQRSLAPIDSHEDDERMTRTKRDSVWKQARPSMVTD